MDEYDIKWLAFILTLAISICIFSHSVRESQQNAHPHKNVVRTIHENVVHYGFIISKRYNSTSKKNDFIYEYYPFGYKSDIAVFQDSTIDVVKMVHWDGGSINNDIKSSNPEILSIDSSKIKIHKIGNVYLRFKQGIPDSLLIKVFKYKGELIIKDTIYFM